MSTLDADFDAQISILYSICIKLKISSVCVSFFRFMHRVILFQVMTMILRYITSAPLQFLSALYSRKTET